MKKNSIWKNVLLLTIGSIFALNIQMASAQDTATTDKGPTGEEECVITEDQV